MAVAPAALSPGSLADKPIAVGTYIVGAIGLLGLANSQFAPVAVAFVTAAVVYNGIQILSRK